MAREWKPGDVAHYDGEQFPGRVFRTDRGWRDTDGDYRDLAQGHLRPLLVLDPDDLDQVKRLADSIGSHFDKVERLQAGLRSLLEPPKPPEPTGVGAVVEDADGDLWVRWTANAAPQWAPWRKVDSAPANHAAWSAIQVVTVHSEGVTPRG